MKSKAILGEIINAKSNKEVALLFGQWAKTYDTDLEKSVQVTKEQSIQLR